MSLQLFFFFFNDTATTEIYTLSLHDALPIYQGPQPVGLSLPGHRPRRQSHRHHAERAPRHGGGPVLLPLCKVGHRDRKSTRLNSSHANISYAVFCLKKKNTNTLLTLVLLPHL